MVVSDVQSEAVVVDEEGDFIEKCEDGYKYNSDDVQCERDCS